MSHRRTRRTYHLQPKLETLEARRLLSASWADFNGDGFSDLAVGAPGETLGTGPSAGAVNVIYGAAAGLTSTNSQFWHQDSPGIVDTAEIADQFGEFLAAGDFNNDGFDDLAIGAPGETIGFQGGAGGVQIIYGSANGLTATGNQYWTQDSPRIREIADAGDRFGSSLAAGDFNADGFDDIGIGAPLEDINNLANTGIVHVLYGRSNGIQAPGNRTFTLDTPGVDGTATFDDFYGTALATGDFTGDGFIDLAIGIPRVDQGESPGGAVSVLHGSVVGLTATGNNFLVAGTPFDAFGGAIAVGDFTGDGRDDLAIGAPGNNANGENASGAVYVVFGDAAGLSMANSDVHTQSDVPGQASEDNDGWGFALAAGDVNADGFDDLAVDAPFEEIDGVFAAGVVNVLFGSSTGMNTAAAVTITQESTGTSNVSEESDLFGRELNMGDFNGDGEADLAIGSPFENLGTLANAGTVIVVYGAGFLNGQEWNQNSPGIESDAAADEVFGSGLGW